MPSADTGKELIDQASTEKNVHAHSGAFGSLPTSDEAGETTVPSLADPAALVAGLSKAVRRQRVFLVIALSAALAASGGLIASTLIKSPAQQAAETKAPPASVLTAPVVRKVLQNTVTTRGIVTASGDINITPTLAGASSAGSQSLVVSKLYAEVGNQIKAGEVLVEVSGRPIFALTGAVPAYRDLKPGTDGPDIAQLQGALKSLGYGCSPDSIGHFGSGTKAALTAFYTHLGYSVPTTGGPNDAGDRTALQAAADAVTTQQRAVDTDASLLDKANKALAAAKAAAQSTQASPSPAVVTPSGEAPFQAAQDEQKSAKTTYDGAVQDLNEAKQKQADLVAATGPMFPASEVVFVSSFPIRLAKLNATLGSTVTAPLLTLESGALAVTSMLQPGQNTLIKPGMKVQLDAEALGDQQATGAVSMIGAYDDGAESRTASGQNTGQNAGVVGNTSGGPAGGQGIGAQSGSGQQTPGYPMTVTPDAPLAAAWAGQDVRVTIVNAATAGPVLSVPLSAVSTGADGQNSVTVVAPDGTQHRVTVTAGASADGDVQIAPTDPDALHVGDNVVIGQAQLQGQVQP